MKTILSGVVCVVALLALLVSAASAQQADSAGARRRSPALTMDDLGSKAAPGQAAQANQPGAPQNEASALLPASDVILQIDARQVLKLLLPQVGSMAPAELLKMKRQLDEFMNKTGIDPLKISGVAVGLSFSSASKASGAVIVQGIEPDMQKIAAALRAEKIVFKTQTYQSKTMLLGTPDGKTLPRMNLTGAAGKAEEVALAPLTGGLVLGDPASVKSVLDAEAGARPGFANALHSEMLAQVSPSAMIRFSAVIPDSFRQTLSQQDKSFSPFAAIRMLGGSFALDAAENGGMALDLRARTSTAREAAQLKTALDGLVMLGKGFFSGGKDPMVQLLSQALDQVQINAQEADVTLSLSLPKAMLDRFRELSSSSKRNVAQNR
ncbi:MAG TPA: hypothetical protein VNQ79_22305 [Blastocatellia bacterium]|nr:hypothetical protein [Blastocatellia bacterium]